LKFNGILVLKKELEADANQILFLQRIFSVDLLAVQNAIEFFLRSIGNKTLRQTHIITSRLWITFI